MGDTLNQIERLGVHLHELSTFTDTFSADSPDDGKITSLTVDKSDPRYSEVLGVLESINDSRPERPKVGERFHVLRLLSGIKFFIKFTVLDEIKRSPSFSSPNKLPAVSPLLGGSSISNVFRVWSRTFEKFVIASELISLSEAYQNLPKGKVRISDIVSQVASKRHNNDRAIVYDTCARLNAYNPLGLSPQNNAKLVVAYAFSSLLYVRSREVCAAGIACPTGYADGFKESSIREFAKDFLEKMNVKEEMKNVASRILAGYGRYNNNGIDIEDLAGITFYLNSLSARTVDGWLLKSIFGLPYESHGIIDASVNTDQSTDMNGISNTYNDTRNLEAFNKEGDASSKEVLDSRDTTVSQDEIDKYGKDKFEYDEEERAAIEKIFSSI